MRLESSMATFDSIIFYVIDEFGDVAIVDFDQAQRISDTNLLSKEWQLLEKLLLTDPFTGPKRNRMSVRKAAWPILQGSQYG